MNKVILMGRLTRDAEVRYSQGENSTAIARFSLAVDRRFRREGDRYPDFAARWVPLEEAYFTQHNIEDAADFVMDTTTD